MTSSARKKSIRDRKRREASLAASRQRSLEHEVATGMSSAEILKNQFNVGNGQSAVNHGAPTESEVSENTLSETQKARLGPNDQKNASTGSTSKSAEPPNQFTVKNIDENVELQSKNRPRGNPRGGGRTGLVLTTSEEKTGSGKATLNTLDLGTVAQTVGQTPQTLFFPGEDEIIAQIRKDEAANFFPGEDELVNAARRQNEFDEVGKASRDIKKTEFESNILSVYENPMYNFRLFITREAAQYETISREETIVIAETGSTGYIIDDIVLDEQIAPGEFTKNTTVSNITFTITEPHGNRLFDQWRNAAIELKVCDFKTAPVWLQLTFKGYSPGANNFEDSSSGGIPSANNGESDELNNINFLWRLEVTDVKVEIDKGGTVYKFNTTPQNQVALRDSARRLEKDEKVEAITVGEYFDELFKRLNNYSNYSLKAKSSSDSTRRIREYGLVFPGKEFSDMEDWIINAPADDKCETARSRQPFESTIENVGKGVVSIKFSKGTPLEAIVQEILGATTEGQAFAIFGEKKMSGSGAGDDNDFRNAGKSAVIFNIESLVTITSYNSIAHLYNIFITYHIRPYRTTKPLLTRTQIENYQEEESKKYLNTVIRISNLRKRYDYIFSGLNTEVLDYNIVFDNAWFLPLPIFRGQDKDGVATSSRIMSEKKKDEQIDQQKPTQNFDEKRSEISILAGALSLAADGGLSNEELDKKTDEDVIKLNITLASLRQDASLNPEMQKELGVFQTAVEKNINDRRTVNLSDINTSLLGARSRLFRLDSDIRNGINQGTVIDQSLVEEFRSGKRVILTAKDIRQPSTSNISTSVQSQDKVGSIFFVEDFERRSVEARNLVDTTEICQRVIAKISTELSPTISSAQTNIEGTVTKGRSYFSSAMNQVYGNFGELTHLELTIKGDPYWMGEPNISRRIIGSDFDLTNADTTILLSFDFPNRFGDGGLANIDSSAGSGLVDLERGDNTFNGIYVITDVKSEFSGGKFTQKLKGYADDVTANQDIISFFTTDQI